MEVIVDAQAGLWKIERRKASYSSVSEQRLLVRVLLWSRVASGKRGCLRVCCKYKLEALPHVYALTASGPVRFEVS